MIVLLYNSKLDKQWLKKLDNRWIGPYIIMDKAQICGIYLLVELDGTALNSIYLGKRLKEFFL